MFCNLLYEVNSKLYVNCYRGGKALSVVLSYITKKKNNFVAVKMEEVVGKML